MNQLISPIILRSYKMSLPYSFTVLQCKIRHNASGDVTTVRFLLTHGNRYFVAKGKERDGNHAVVEFYCLDRAFTPETAIRHAKLRGHDSPAAEHSKYYSKIDRSITKYCWLNDDHKGKFLEELGFGGPGPEPDMTLSDTDTFSDTNLSECSGDTEFAIMNNRLDTLLEELGISEPEDDEDILELRRNVLAFDNTYRMLHRKYQDPISQEILRHRRLAFWCDQLGVTNPPLEQLQLQAVVPVVTDNNTAIIDTTPAITVDSPRAAL